MRAKRTLLKTWVLSLVLTSPAALAEQSEPRVVALNWEAAEHLLKLNITPVAVVDAEDYRTWVITPALPPSVLNAGSRNEPNLELLAELRPDLIVSSPVLERVQPLLERIAPVLSLPDYRADQAALSAVRQRFLHLAARLGLQQLADSQLSALNEHLDELACALRARFPDRLPSVTLMRFASPTVAMVFGSNSMPDVVLDRLGLKSAFPLPPASWGITQLPVSRLAEINHGYVLYFEPFHHKEKLFESEMWRSMPFVRAKHFAGMPPTWTYGGLFSLEHIAQSTFDALLAASPEPPRLGDNSCAGSRRK